MYKSVLHPLASGHPGCRSVNRSRWAQMDGRADDLAYVSECRLPLNLQASQNTDNNIWNEVRCSQGLDAKETKTRQGGHRATLGNWVTDVVDEGMHAGSSITAAR